MGEEDLRHMGRYVMGWIRGACAGAFCAALLWGGNPCLAVPGVAEAGQVAPVRGGPRLSLDKELIDFGPVRYRQYVEVRFRLKNVGDQPLQLPASPPVEVVEGC